MMKNPVRLTATALALALPMFVSQPAAACNSDPYMGTVCTFAFGFCPNNYLPADGRLIAISQNTALFSLLGTYYGGNGITTFGLPDLRGRAVVGVGQGPGLSSVVIGETRGVEQVQLTTSQIPSHTHSGTFTGASADLSSVPVTVAGNNLKLNAATSGTLTNNPAGASLAVSPATTKVYSNGTPGAAMSAGSISGSMSGTLSGTAPVTGTINTAAAGSGAAVTILPPELGMMVCIATTGIFPSRN